MRPPEPLPARVRAYMAAWDMLPEDDSGVLCACSGGADSTALLHLLRRMEGLRVCCAHFNHSLRGPEADRDEDFVRGLCEQWDIPFVSGRADVAALARAGKTGVEETARRARYAFLTQAAEELGCGRIATAHNAGDNAETVLFHLLRGSGARGLAGIPPVRGKLIRPLLGVEREEIEAYLLENGLSHMEDESNGSDRYARNRLRHAVMPVLRELNSAAVRNICASAELLREDEAYLDGLCRDFLKNSGDRVCVSALLALPRPVAMRALRALCGGDRAHLEAVYALCAGERRAGGVSLSGGFTAVRNGDTLRISPPPSPVRIPARALKSGQTIEVPEAGRAVTVQTTVFSGGIHNSFNTFYLKRENISDGLCVRSKTPGDALRLAGRSCSKTLKKLFAEAAVPREKRGTVLVIADERGVLAVEGLALAERCVPQTGDSVLRVEIVQTDGDREKERHTEYDDGFAAE